MKSFMDVEKLRLNEPIIHQVMMLRGIHKLTDEEAMAMIIEELIKQKNFYHDELVKMKMTSTQRNF